MKTIHYSFIECPLGALLIARTEKGLCFVGSPGESAEELQRKYPAAQLSRDDVALTPYRKELESYFTGESRSFQLPVDAKGTIFQEKVWAALAEIPYGETWSYSDIATAIQNPSAVRAVGAAIGANPAMIVIPCHRVIGKNGKLTGFRGGLPLKRFLLDLESIDQKGADDHV